MTRIRSFTPCLRREGVEVQGVGRVSDAWVKV